MSSQVVLAVSTSVPPKDKPHEFLMCSFKSWSYIGEVASIYNLADLTYYENTNYDFDLDDFFKF